MRFPLASSVVAAVVAGTVRAEEPRFDAAAAVAESIHLVEKFHLRQPRLDEPLSERWFRAFAEELDPRYLYFHSTDVAAWRKEAPTFAAAVRRGDLGVPRRVAARFRERVPAAMKLASAAVEAEHDFTVMESCPRTFDDWAPYENALRERWRLDVKREDLVERLAGFGLEETRNRLRSRHARIAKAAGALDDERLVTLLIRGLLRELAPRDSYLSPSFIDQFNGGKFAEYRLSLYLEHRRGRWYVGCPANSQFTHARGETLTGLELVAIRRLDGTVIDLVERSPEELSPLLSSPFGEIGTDTEVLLELYDPVRIERHTISWPRIANR